MTLFIAIMVHPDLTTATNAVAATGTNRTSVDFMTPYVEHAPNCWDIEGWSRGKRCTGAKMWTVRKGALVQWISRLRRNRCTAIFAISLIVATIPLASSSHADATTAPPQWRVTDHGVASTSWYATTYAAGRFVVVGHGTVAASSTNAVTWTTHSAPPGQWQSVAFGDSKFVALSASNEGAHEMISRDGVHWSASAGPRGEWTGLTYGEGRFVAVSAEGQFITSTDGVHWIATWTRSQFLLNSVTFGNGRFVAVDSADGDALISLNGINWSFYTIAHPGTPWFAVSFGNGIFSTLSPSGLSATSMLGYTWVTHPTAVAQQMNASAFGCNTFVATGQIAGNANYIIASHFATSWTASRVPTDVISDWTGVTFGANEFVAVDTAGTIASHHVAGYCGPTVATPPQDVSGNVASGQVWTYQHPPASQGGAPIDSYLVSITDGTRTFTCRAALYYQPNCIIRGLSNRRVYFVTTQVHNRFGYSAPSDPEWVTPVAKGSLQAVSTTPAVYATQPVVVQVTGVVANSEGIYPQSPVTVHFGNQVSLCVPSPFGECFIDVTHPPLGRVAISAKYVGYGVAYHSATSYVRVLAGS